MLLYAPGRVAPGRSEAPVSLVDIAPTILDLLGIDPGSPMQGRSLVALAKDAEAPDFEQRAVYAERLDGLELAVHRKRLKWILNEREPTRSAAYDLVSDPAERQEITSEESLAGGLRFVEQHREASSRVRAGFKGAETSPAELGEATVRELRALGYVE
jgi:choline-sulfatase